MPVVADTTSGLAVDRWLSWRSCARSIPQGFQLKWQPRSEAPTRAILEISCQLELKPHRAGKRKLHMTQTSLLSVVIGSAHECTMRTAFTSNRQLKYDSEVNGSDGTKHPAHK